MGKRPIIIPHASQGAERPQREPRRPRAGGRHQQHREQHDHETASAFLQSPGIRSR